jgi:enoyl-CoA hydratase/carnithine racemase
MSKNVEHSLEQGLVLCDERDGVATLTLNSAANFNALSRAMIAALQTALDSIAARNDIRVVVIGARGRAFCAGHDLREMQTHPDEAWQRAHFDRCSKMMMTIASMPQPVVAKVQGIATAAGCQLVATCDLAVASVDAKFATSGVNLGLFCSTPAVALTRVIAAKHAAEMLFTGEFIDANTAARIGLINRAVEADRLEAETESLARRIAVQSGAALASGKRLLLQLANKDANELAHDYDIAAANMARDMRSSDAKLGIDAFIRKTTRPPWTNR